MMYLYFSVDHYHLVQICPLMVRLEHLFFYNFFVTRSFVSHDRIVLIIDVFLFFLLLYTHILICEYMVILCYLHRMCIVILDYIFFFLYGGKKILWKSLVFIFKKEMIIRWTTCYFIKELFFFSSYLYIKCKTA